MPNPVGNGFYYTNTSNPNDYIYQKLQGEDCNYAMGMDPIWGITSNKLQFQNGVKMKISVIMGIFHMTIGIIMKGTNAVHHGHWVDLVTEVIFGLIIFYGLFGWMDFMIIKKWFKELNIDDNNFFKSDAAYNMDTNGTYASHCPTGDPTCTYDITNDPSPANFSDGSLLYTDGQFSNQRIPSIIQIMITTDFMGEYTDDFDPIVFDTNKA